MGKDFVPNPNLASELEAELGGPKRVVLVYVEDDDEPQDTPRTTDPRTIHDWFNRNVERWG